MTDSFGRSEKSGRRVSAGMIMGGLAGALALIFIFQNTESGTVNFLAWDFTFATWIWALILFALGAVTGYTFHWTRRKK